MFFDVDPDVFSVGLRRIDLPVHSSLGQEDLEGRDSTADAGDYEHGRGQQCKQVPQNEHEKSESDQQQSDDEKSGCEVSGGLRNCICVKAKTHISDFSV
jgi:hypothetical protein